MDEQDNTPISDPHANVKKTQQIHNFTSKFLSIFSSPSKNVKQQQISNNESLLFSTPDLATSEAPRSTISNDTTTSISKTTTTTRKSFTATHGQENNNHIHVRPSTDFNPCCLSQRFVVLIYVM